MHLIVRADANTAIGTGHLMRCLALAQAWQNQAGEVTFITACDSENLCQRLLDEGFNLVKLKAAHPDSADWSETSKILTSNAGSWVILDGYYFDPAYQKKIKDLGCRLLVIDDMAHLDHYYADIILNQNINAEEKTYFCEPYTEQLLGTRYVLLRREFWQWQNSRQREIPPVARKILVTMGGGDPDNVTLKVLQALEQVDIKDLMVNVVVGAANPNHEQLEQFVAQSRNQISLNKNVENMPDIMAWADLAISAGGSTCWELLYMGLPSLIIITADNQRANVTYLTKDLLVTRIGEKKLSSTKSPSFIIKRMVMNQIIRKQKSMKGQKLIDGYGAIRVFSFLTKSIYLRIATISDCKLLWTWVNEAEVRNQSFNTRYIEYEEHNKWFTEKINDNNCMIYICLDHQDLPIGQIRFDIDKPNNQALVDISVEKTKRGYGYGDTIINAGINEINKQIELKRYLANIKLDNYASQKVFRKAGFIMEKKDCNYVQYVKENL